MKKPLWRTGLALATAVVMTAATSGPVAAQTTGADSIEYTLTGSETTSSSLAGSEAGSFAYYRIAYPGNAAELRVQVRFAEYQGGVSPLGFNVYGPNGRVDKGAWQSENDCLEITYQEDEPATLLVQVYNYGSADMPYSITAVGLPEVAEAEPEAAGASATATPSAAGTEEQAPEEAAAWGTVSGAVIGDRAGAFAAHTIQSSGDGEDITVTMTVSPADPLFSVAFGLNVYSPSGQLVAVAAETGDQGVREATWASDAEGSYYLQVYNYSDGVVMYYTLEVAD